MKTDARLWQRIGAIFDAAVEAPPGERAALLDRQCDGDAQLRAEVERLLVEFVEEGQAEGDLRAMNPLSASRLVQALFDALTPQLLVNPDEILEFAMIGLLADPARLPEIRSAAADLDIPIARPSI